MSQSNKNCPEENENEILVSHSSHWNKIDHWNISCTVHAVYIKVHWLSGFVSVFPSIINLFYNNIIIIIVCYRAAYSTEIDIMRLTFKTQLKHILSSYRSNTFHT